MIKSGDIIKHEGKEWRVVSLGRVREDGKVYAHLASTKDGFYQRNGFNPVQICDWVKVAA